ncbi:MAG: PilT/PilU family type 4a pilus ATPase [Roseburia sp.]|nr:PilT/PilU family type 4a pilus ATPase [Roseburia sp.]MCM1241759.1 PilT/PilU family type 4a pilus ATPase [Roseburia sp.]
MSLIKEIMQAAAGEGASDVHITAGLPPRMRINGHLHSMNLPKMTAKDTLEIVLEMMTEQQRRVYEEYGEYNMSFMIQGIGRCRVSVYRQRGQTALSLRLISLQIPSCAELGIPESVLELYDKEAGLILVTGPAGSGKTTTLASLIDKINSSREVHILTLESPIEYLHKHKLAMVNQREIGQDSLSYAAALKAALREDADVLMIGEITDAETIEAALLAAETGHLVLTSMSALGAADMLERIVDAFLPHKQQQMRRRFANVLQAVVFQQLKPSHDGRGRVASFEVLEVDEEKRMLLKGEKAKI